MLTQLNEQFVTRDSLSNQPTLLDHNHDNHRAVAHCLRLSAYYYPHAYGVGHKRMPMEDLATLLNHEATLSFGIGEGHDLQAGAILAMPRYVIHDHFEVLTEPSIIYLFRLPGRHLQNVGKRLLKRCLEEVATTDPAAVYISVVKSNVTARNLYERIGFQPERRSYSSHQSFRFVDLKLMADKITKAIDGLNNLTGSVIIGGSDEQTGDFDRPAGQQRPPSW